MLKKLALLYCKDQGVTQDQKEAFNSFKFAAEQGDA
jgi:TPR repeat protein